MGLWFTERSGATTPNNGTADRKIVVYSIRNTCRFECSCTAAANSIETKEKLVDVTGLEPVTPCLQSGVAKTLTALSGVAYTENQRNSRSFKCTEVVPNYLRHLSGTEWTPSYRNPWVSIPSPSRLQELL